MKGLNISGSAFFTVLTIGKPNGFQIQADYRLHPRSIMWFMMGGYYDHVGFPFRVGVFFKGERNVSFSLLYKRKKR